MLSYLALLLFILFFLGLAQVVMATYKVFFEKKGNRRLTPKELARRVLIP
jgi:hypothetical protein